MGRAGIHANIAAMVTGPSRESAAPAALAAAFAVAHVAGQPQGVVALLGVAALGTLLTGYRPPRRLAVLAIAMVATAIASHVHRAVAARHYERRSRAWVAERVAEIEASQRALAASLVETANEVAALPSAAAAIRGDAADRSQLFPELAARGHGRGQGRFPDSISLTVYDGRRQALAWYNRVGSPWHAARLSSEGRPIRKPEAPGGLADSLPDHTEVFVSDGAVSTTLVARSPVRGPGGGVIGLTSAELPLAVRRHIRNEFLSDFDLLAGDDGAVTIRYRDVGDTEAEAMGDLPPPPADTISERRMLRGADGLALAAFQVTAPPMARVAEDLGRWYGYGLALLATAFVLAWLSLRSGAGHLTLGTGAVAATAWRALWVLLPLPSWAALESSDLYARQSVLPTAFSRLADTPLQLLLTAAWLAIVSTWLARRGLSRPRALLPAYAWTAADLVCLGLVATTFFVVRDVSWRSQLELDRSALFPSQPVEGALQWALLLIVMAGGAAMVAVQSFFTAWPVSTSGRILRLSGWVLLAGIVYAVWPRMEHGLPLFSAVSLFAAAAIVFATPAAKRLSLTSGSMSVRLALFAALIVVGEIILQPALVYYGEKNRRLQIERDYAPLVLERERWQEDILTRARGTVDALHVLEDLPPNSDRTGIEELAFAVWSETELAMQGLSSAIEIQDEQGAVISRFALNMPALLSSSGPSALPEDDEWRLDWDVLPVVSSRQRARHAERRLVYGGRVYGAVHVYVADDFWNLPFLEGRDPYPTLFRTTPRGRQGDRPVQLMVYGPNRDLLWSSAERPPGFASAITWPLPPSPAGSWRTVKFGNALRYVYFFTQGADTFGLSFARASVAQYAGNIVEGAAGAALVPLVALLLVLAVRSFSRGSAFSLRTVARGVSSRFSVRLFVALVVLAAVPVAVLDGVMRRFLEARLAAETERQALAQAAVAQKAVEDYAFLQRGERKGGVPITDAAAVWVASLIRNDLDIFQGGFLAASSKRELYASGLLGGRVYGSVYRALVLQGEPSTIRTERIGEFSYLVVSVPVRLNQPEPAILSIPLALRQRDVQAVLEDLDRTIRLGSVLFLIAAAMLAHRMARRISGPIRDLTAATQRVAAGDLEARVTATSRDELRQLVESFNRMAADLDRQRTELERSNRLAAWADMARQVAHEVKNPLTPIQLSAQHLRRVFKDGGPGFAIALETCTSTILEQVKKLREIATEFSSFARPPAAERLRASISDLVRDALAPYRASPPDGVQLAVDLDPAAPAVRVDRRLFDRAIVNLIENALQALDGEPGQVRVTVRGAQGRATVEVTDSGPGIDAAVRARVFEPFFSTKSAGSGLGLVLVKKIVEDHGGGISLDNAPGRGVRVTVWLPVDATRDSA
jgi:signal transduction histidine kinase